LLDKDGGHIEGVRQRRAYPVAAAACSFLLVWALFNLVAITSGITGLGGPLEALGANDEDTNELDTDDDAHAYSVFAADHMFSRFVRAETSDYHAASALEERPSLVVYFGLDGVDRRGHRFLEPGGLLGR